MADSTQDWLCWYDSLYRYARALCHDPAFAEELVQETYKRALAARRKPASPASGEFRRWLFTVLRHVWQNELRDRHSHAAKDAEYEACARQAVETPDVALDRKLLLSELHHALDCLPGPYREVLVLREIEDLSYSEIAALLECPTGTVMSRLARARDQLRRHLAAAPRTPRETRS